MNLSPDQYSRIVKKASPNTKSYKTIPAAFFVGGLICVGGQLLTNIYMYYGMPKLEASSLSSLTLIVAAAILTGLNIYDNIAKFAGAGTVVPITGFSNSVVSPAMEFKSEGYILGLGAKMFIIAGPVIVYGVLASVLYGIIAYIFHLY